MNLDSTKLGEPHPFRLVSHLWAADGVFYAGGEPVAKFDDGTGLWHEFDTDSRWPVLVLTAPAG